MPPDLGVSALSADVATPATPYRTMPAHTVARRAITRNRVDIGLLGPRMSQRGPMFTLVVVVVVMVVFCAPVPPELLEQRPDVDQSGALKGDVDAGERHGRLHEQRLDLIGREMPPARQDQCDGAGDVRGRRARSRDVPVPTAAIRA